MHGLGQASCMQYTLFKYLSKYFYCIYVDIPGAGTSSRPNNYNNNFTIEQSYDYMLGYIEKWRAAMNLTDFFLVGHSFGGHYVGHYAKRYPQHIKRVLFLSPIGFPSYSEEELDIDYILENDPSMENRSCQFNCLICCCVRPQYSYQQILRNTPMCYITQGSERFASARLKADTDEKVQAIAGMLKQINLRPQPTEHTLTHFFAFTLRPRKGLSSDKMLGAEDFKVPFSITFGDDDWVKNFDRGAS